MLMMINVLEKLMPAAAKLGTKTVIELVSVASIGAGVVSFGLDRGSKLAKEKLDDKLEAKKQELMKKREAVLEQKAEQTKEQQLNEEETQKVDTVEEKHDNASKKKKNK